MLGIGQAFLRQAEKYGLVCVFAAMVLLFWFTTDAAGRFGTQGNIEVVLVTNMVKAAMALAFILPLLAGQFDLSVGHNLALSAVLTAVAFERWDWPLWLAIAGGIAVATLVGIVNGLLVVVGEINSLIVTLGTATVIQGLLMRLSGGNTVVILKDSLLADQRAFPRPVLFVLVLAIVVWYLLEHTPWGRRLHGVGSNAESARLVGINVKASVFSAFAGAGVIAGLAGILQVARDSGGNPQNGPGFLLPVFAAAFLGATVLKHTFNVWGTIIGLLFVAFAVNGLQLAGAAPYIEDVFNGVALLVAVAITAYVGRMRGRRMFF